MDDSSIRHPWSRSQMWFNYLSKGNLLWGTVKIRIQARCAISLQFASRSQALCIFLFCAPARREFAATVLPLSQRGNFNTGLVFEFLRYSIQNLSNTTGLASMERIGVWETKKSLAWSIWFIVTKFPPTPVS